jgi:hypothetical protein
MNLWDGSRIKIPVEQRHIDRALERASSHCVIAEAIQEAIPDATFVSVDLQSVRWTRKGLRYVCLTPYAARDLIIAFDQGERDKLVPCVLSMRPAQISRAGKRTRQTPSNDELRGTGLTVSKKQIHISEPKRRCSSGQLFQGAGPPPSTKMESKAELRHQLELACANTARLANGEALEPTATHVAVEPKRVARALVSRATKGSVPVTLGGRLPPVSILSRREFGLRQIRR